jgi:DNA-binding GntR family transcriptional regulator
MALKILLRKEIAKTIRKSILSGQFQPGERIPIEYFTKKLHVSPTPVQDAFLMLEQEGLVVIKPHSGVYVRTFTREELVDVLLVEGMCESLAVSMAAKRITPSQLAAIEKWHQEFASNPSPEYRRFRNYDLKLHFMIVTSSRSQVLIDLLTKQLYQISLSRYYTSTAPNRLPHSIAEHEKIIKCLRERDSEGAEKAVRSHLESAVRDLLSSPE